MKDYGEVRRAHLSSGYDEILAPVQDSNAAIGILDSQITRIEMTAPERFRSRLGVAEVLHRTPISHRPARVTECGTTDSPLS